MVFLTFFLNIQIGYKNANFYSNIKCKDGFGMGLTTFCILTLLFYETRDLRSISNYLLHEHWSFSTNDNILVFGTEFLKFSIEPYASMKRLRITMHNAIEYRVEEWRFQ